MFLNTILMFKSMIIETIGTSLGIGCGLTGLLGILDHSLREKPYESRLTHLADRIKPERIVYKNKEIDRDGLKHALAQFDTGTAILRQYAIAAGGCLPRVTKSGTFFKSPDFLWDFVQNNTRSVGKKRFDLSGKYFATLRNQKDKSMLQVTFPTNHFSAHYTLAVLGPRKDAKNKSKRFH